MLDAKQIHRRPPRPVPRASCTSTPSPAGCTPPTPARLRSPRSRSPFPEDADDVAVLVRYCFEHNLPLIPRGAGTGLAGEILGPAVILDLSVNFRGILRHHRRHGHRRTGGDVRRAECGSRADTAGGSPRTRPALPTCTVGGMVATNASGGNAFRFGYTRDYVAGLGWCGTRAKRTSSARRRETAVAKRGRTGQIARTVADCSVPHRDLDRQHPSATFNRCGYLLHDVLTDRTADLAKLSSGRREHSAS